MFERIETRNRFTGRFAKKSRGDWLPILYKKRVIKLPKKRPGRKMWIAVTPRFRNFNSNLSLTDDQKEAGTRHHKGVRTALNANYYNLNSDTANSFLAGSWGKYTRIRPPGDIDLLFVLPFEVYSRFQSYEGNRQSSLLQEVKNVLLKSYPNTEMRGDGQVVIVGFNRMDVEVIPAFALENGQYYICDTNNGGRYKNTDPKAEIHNISNINKNCSDNLRKLIKMAKCWKDFCAVPLKSFHIELTMCDFLELNPWRNNSFYYYDWIIRDYFKYLSEKPNSFVVVPGTYEIISLGDKWHSKAVTAYNRSLNACTYEYNDEVQNAGIEWQKIFGDKIPIAP